MFGPIMRAKNTPHKQQQSQNSEKKTSPLNHISLQKYAIELKYHFCGEKKEHVDRGLTI